LKNVLEVGCGVGLINLLFFIQFFVGNTLFPLLELCKSKHFYSFDFSEKAISILQQNQAYNENLVHAFVLDIVNSEFPDFVPAGNIDFVIIIFVLSAISPEHYNNIFAKLYKVMKEGAIILFRDYGLGDLAGI